MEKDVITDFDKRIALFIEAKGGDSAVARVTGKSPQLFQGVRTGKRNAGMHVFQELLKNYDDFDETYMLRGIKTMNVKYPKPIDSELEIERLKKEVEKKEKALAEKEAILSMQQEIINKKELVIENLSAALGKHEGGQSSLLVDTEQGAEVMAAIFGTQVLSALFEKENV